MKFFHVAWFSIPALIVALCLGVIGYNWAAIRAAYDLWDAASSRNPSFSYWPTAQVLRELEDVRLDLKAIADGSTVEPDALSFHIDVLISGINIIVRPSQLNDSFKTLPGFSEDGAALEKFATEVLPAIKTDISSADAQASRQRSCPLSKPIFRQPMPRHCCRSWRKWPLSWTESPRRPWIGIVS